MLLFRQTDARYPFLWEDAAQPAARWHGPGEGPAHYLADTPDGAWAELLRHEEIVDPADLMTLRRALWVVDVPDGPAPVVRIPRATATGSPARTYAKCQSTARRLRASGVARLRVPSAALRRGSASGFRVDGGVIGGAPRNGSVVVLFGHPRDLTGWLATAEGRPSEALLPRVRHYAAG